MWIVCSPRELAAASACLNSTSTLAGLFVGFTSTAMMVVVGTSSRSTSTRFGVISVFKVVMPVRLPPGRFRLTTKPSLTGSPHQEHDRNCRGRCLCGEYGKTSASSCDHVHRTASQFDRQRRQTLVFAPGPSVFDRHVLVLDVTGLF